MFTILPATMMQENSLCLATVYPGGWKYLSLIQTECLALYSIFHGQSAKWNKKSLQRAPAAN